MWRKGILRYSGDQAQSKRWHVNNVSTLPTTHHNRFMLPGHKSLCYSLKGFRSGFGYQQAAELDSCLATASAMPQARRFRRTFSPHDRFRHGVSAPCHADFRTATVNSSSLPRSFGGNPFETLRKLCGT
jgi:hypothetical protein